MQRSSSSSYRDAAAAYSISLVSWKNERDRRVEVTRSLRQRCKLVFLSNIVPCADNSRLKLFSLFGLITCFNSVGNDRVFQDTCEYKAIPVGLERVTIRAGKHKDRNPPDELKTARTAILTSLLISSSLNYSLT